MPVVTQTEIENALQSIIDPNSGQDLIASKALKAITIEGSTVAVELLLGYPAKGFHQALTELVEQPLLALEGVDKVTVSIHSEVVAHAVQGTLKPMPNVKNIVAVASGKGGVGKSTTAVNLALALTAEGARVGLLDADIYGPSLPLMLGLSGYPESGDGKTMLPKVAYGVQSISIGYLIDEETPMIWRGPMVTNALQQLIRDTRWDDLDYLIVDLPPGTGDTQLTLSQSIPVSGAIIVTTPQDIALLDAQRGLKMFEKVAIPVLGIVENMSTHICSNCGHEEPIFGSGGGAMMSKKHNVELLGALPLDIKIRQDADGGQPTVVADPDGPVAAIYRQIARKMSARLALRAKDYRGKFPKIVVQND